MDKEKRAADWPIKPGVIVGHSSDGETPFDVGVEVGMTAEDSLYIGEVSNETLADYGVKVPFQGRWLCHRTGNDLRPIALVACGDSGDAHVDLARVISGAIRAAYAAGRTEAMGELYTGADLHTDNDTPSRLLADLCALLARPEVDRVPGCKRMMARAAAMMDRGL